MAQLPNKMRVEVSFDDGTVLPGETWMHCRGTGGRMDVEFREVSGYPIEHLKELLKQKQSQGLNVRIRKLQNDGRPIPTLGSETTKVIRVS